MSKIAKWHEARKTHEDLVARAREWCHPSSGELGVVTTASCHGGALQSLAVDWIASRKAELYSGLIAYSRERLAAAAREALAECEQILADVHSDLGSLQGHK